jgi:SAM-dependent methyltransferase
MPTMQDQAIAELAHFLGIPFKEAADRVAKYSVLDAADRWNKNPHATVADVEKFYTGSNDYLYELIPWNYGSAEFHRRIEPLFHYHNKRIVEIGAGIGSLCIALAYAGNDVTYVDINPTLQAFAMQRFTDRQMAIPIYPDLTYVRDQDIVVAIDVMEHIHPTRLPDLLKDIAHCLRDGGFLYCRSNFKQQDVYPMHYDYSQVFNKLCIDAGLVLREDGCYTKGGESLGVQIGIPILGDVPDPLFYSFMGLKKHPGWKLTKIRDKDVATARNDIIDKLERDWLFFMDADQTFPPETIERLLSWNVDVISGLYFKSPGMPLPHAYEYAYANTKNSGENDYWYMPKSQAVGKYLDRYRTEILAAKEEAMILPATREDLIPIDGCGGGCLLVHRRVIEKLEKPYFKFTEGARAGEDFYFCRQIRQAGFDIWLDPGVICGHKQKGFIGAAHFLHWSTTKPDSLRYMYPWGAEATHTTAANATSTEASQ